MKGPMTFNEISAQDPLLLIQFHAHAGGVRLAAAVQYICNPSPFRLPLILFYEFAHILTPTPGSPSGFFHCPSTMSSKPRHLFKEVIIRAVSPDLVSCIFVLPWLLGQSSRRANAPQACFICLLAGHSLLFTFCPILNRLIHCPRYKPLYRLFMS